MTARPGDALPEVARVLRQVRARYRARTLLRGAFWSLMATAVAWLVLQLAARASVAGALPSGAGGAGWLLTGVAAAGLALTALRALRATPSLLACARRADVAFGLQERLSTAWELPPTAAPSDVATALRRDARAAAARVAPRRLVPLSVPTVRWLTPLLLVLLVGVRWLPMPGAAPAVATAGAVTEPEEVAALGANVRRLAELIDRDAADRHDPYLQAVARSFESLGARLEQGEVGGADADRELAALLEHLERALGPGTGSLGRILQPFAAPGSAAADAAAGPAESGLEVASPTVEAGGGDGEERSGARPLGQPQAGAGQDDAAGAGADGARNPRGTLEALLQSLEARDEPPSASRAGVAGAQPADAMANYEGLPPEMLAALELAQRRAAEEPIELDAAGVSIGAADEAGQGPGNEAGDGARALTEGRFVGRELDPTEAAPEDVVLPWQERDAGRRIRIGVEPETQADAVPQGPVDAQAAWARSSGTIQVRGSLDTAYREVVSRYFLPATGEAAGE